jgi:hypothetical protein
VPLRSCCHSAQQQLPSGTVVATTGSSAAVSTLHRGSWAGCLRRAASAGSSGPGAIGAVVRVGAAATSGEATAPRCRSWSGRAGGSKSVGCDRRRLGKPPVQPGGALQPHPVWPRYSREAVRREAVCAVCATCARVVGNLERVVFSSLVLFSSPVASFFGRFSTSLKQPQPPDQGSYRQTVCAGSILHARRCR